MIETEAVGELMQGEYPDDAWITPHHRNLPYEFQIDEEDQED